ADGHDHASRDRTWRSLLVQAGDDFCLLGRWLMFGALLAAALQTLFPRGVLLALGDGPLLSVLVMILLAGVLSVCSVVDSFVSLSFAQTFPLGAVLAFLSFGPMVDLKSIAMYFGAFSRGTVVIVLLLCFEVVLLAGVFVNLNLS